MRVPIRVPEVVTERMSAYDALLYEARPRIARLLKAGMYVTGILALVSLVGEYGFYLPPVWQQVVHVLNGIVVWGFILNNLAQLAIAPNRREHFRARWFDLALTGLLLVIYLSLLPGLANELFQRVMRGFSRTLDIRLEGEAAHLTVTRLYLALTQGFLLFGVVVEGIRYSHAFLQQRFKPVAAVVISFVLIIVTGALGLMLPKASAGVASMPFIDALFTSTSAVCVTGLIVVDTQTYFTWLGQTIIVILIQIGGLGLATLTLFFVIFIESRVSVREYAYMRDVLNDATVASAKQTLKNMIFFTLGLEAAGAAVLYIWTPAEFIIDRPRWFYALFHSVSAFCNAGFGLWTNNLADGPIRFSIPINFTIMGLIITGGLGFSVLNELWTQGGNILRGKPIRLSVHTRIVLRMTTVLIVIGAAAYMILERDQTQFGLTPWQRILSGLFQSVTPRTAGFNTLDVTKILTPTAMFVTLLMGIGASPGGTGGGVKTTTTWVAILSALATTRGRKSVEFLRRQIPEEIIHRAMTILLFGSNVIFISVFILTISDPQFDLVRVLFEETSAFGTVGLSMGITAGMSVMGKTVLIVSMFLGRVGPLTIAIALSQRKDRAKFEYPTEEVMVM